MKLLIVDNDHDMIEMLVGWLKTHGFQVQYAFAGEQARIKWLEQRPDLVIADAGLRGTDILALCREMRSTHDALVLVLTGESSPQTEIRCLESGADDCLVKPFLPSQLLAHISALSRRVRTTLERNPSFAITVGPIYVDTLRNEVRVSGRIQRLTPTESKVLHILAANPNDVCTLNQIVTHVWGYGGAGDTCLVKAHIRHLREKIEANPSKPHYIVTVPGVGYSLLRYPEDTETAFSHSPLANRQQAVDLRNEAEEAISFHPHAFPLVSTATFDAAKVSNGG